VPWIARMPRMSTSLVGRSHIYTFLAGRRIRRNQRNSAADASATTVQNIPDLSIFRSTTCLHFHDCAHGDGLRRRQECHGFRRFLDSARRCMDSSDASNVYITDWTKLQHILSWLGENPAGISAQLRTHQ
jgi:hypothetical protein